MVHSSPPGRECVWIILVDTTKQKHPAYDMIRVHHTHAVYKFLHQVLPGRASREDLDASLGDAEKSS